MESERRQAFRCNVPDGTAQAVLSVGKVDHPVDLVDESRFGFGILAAENPGVQAGQSVWLQTRSGCTEVRIAKVRREGEKFRLGLERIRELPIPDYKSSFLRGLFSSSERSLTGRPKRLPLPNFGLGIMMALSIAVALVSWHWIWGDAQKWASGPRLTLAERMGRDNSHKHAPVSKDLPSVSPGPFAPARLPASAILWLPDVADDLELSQTQRERIDLILAGAATAAAELRNVSGQVGAGHLSVHSRQELDKALASIQRLLTKSQREAWQAAAAERSE